MIFTHKDSITLTMSDVPSLTLQTELPTHSTETPTGAASTPSVTSSTMIQRGETDRNLLSDAFLNDRLVVADFSRQFSVVAVFSPELN